VINSGNEVRRRSGISKVITLSCQNRYAFFHFFVICNDFVHVMDERYTLGPPLNGWSPQVGLGDRVLFSCLFKKFIVY
jgi:hypothetical protein